MKVYISGELVDANEAQLSLFDHGVLYGDNIFEEVRLRKERLFKLDEHLKRLEMSAKVVLMALPWDREEIAEAICEVCRANALVDGLVRIIVTRGKGSLGCSPSRCEDPQLIIVVDQVEHYSQEYYKQGLNVVTVATRRAVSALQLPQIVRMSGTMAALEAEKMGYPEAIVLNDRGYIAGCTRGTLFAVSKGSLFTPRLSDGAERSIVRDVIFEIAASLSMHWQGKPLIHYDLWNAEECFVVSCGMHILSIIEVDGRTIGEGHPGPIVKQMAEIFQERMQQDGRALKEIEGIGAR